MPFAHKLMTQLNQRDLRLNAIRRVSHQTSEEPVAAFIHFLSTFLVFLFVPAIADTGIPADKVELMGYAFQELATNSFHSSLP